MSMFACKGISFDIVSLLCREELNTLNLFWFVLFFPLSSDLYFSV